VTALDLAQLPVWLGSLFWAMGRVGGLCLVAPVFSSTVIPARVRVAVVMVLTMVLAPALPPDLGLALLRVNFLLNLLVIAHILRHAVGSWFLVGLLFAFGYALLLNKFFALADALLGVAPT